jgi:hypothetical protein
VWTYSGSGAIIGNKSEDRSCCLMGIEFQVCKMRNNAKITLKMDNMVKIYVNVFLAQFLKMQ